MARLYIHRIEPVERDGKIILEKVPEKPEQQNMGVTYRFEVRQIDETHAKAYGWSTGYPCRCDGGPQGMIYAPKGFRKGEMAFVDIEDALLSISSRDSSSLDLFLANLNSADVSQAIDRLKGFSVMGEILDKIW